MDEIRLYHTIKSKKTQNYNLTGIWLVSVLSGKRRDKAGFCFTDAISYYIVYVAKKRKGVTVMTKKWKEELFAVAKVLCSALIYSFAFKVFIVAGNLYPAGFSGIARLLSAVLQDYVHIHIPFSVLYLLLNIGPTFLVYRYIGKRFTYLSILQYVAVSIFTAVIPSFPITYDLILIAIFGGIVAGVGNSIALRTDASSGGTDFIAIYAANKYKIPTWSYVMYFNAVILVIAGFLYGWEISLYSILYQWCNTNVVSRMHLRYQLNSLFIITEHPDEVSNAIFQTARHGITKLHGEGAFSKTPKDMLYLTCNAFQVNMILAAIKQADPKAFVTVNKTERVVGNYYQVPFK